MRSATPDNKGLIRRGKYLVTRDSSEWKKFLISLPILVRNPITQKNLIMATVFTKIINGEIPSYKIAEDEHHYSFLDINPISKGHTLVIPKEPTDYLFDLPDERLQSLITFAKPIAHAIDKALNCMRTGLIVEGLEVPHAHLHLVPIYKPHQVVALGMENVEMEKKEMEEIAEKIREALV